FFDTGHLIGSFGDLRRGDTAGTHEDQVHLQGGYPLDNVQADGDQGIFIDLATQKEEFDVGVVGQFQGNGQAIGIDGGPDVLGEVAHHGQVGGPVTDDHGGTLGNKPHGLCGNGLFFVDVDNQVMTVFIELVGLACGAPVHPLDQALVGKALEVAAYGVLRYLQFQGQLMGVDFFLGIDQVQYNILSFVLVHRVMALGPKVWNTPQKARSMQNNFILYHI